MARRGERDEARPQLRPDGPFLKESEDFWYEGAGFGGQSSRVEEEDRTHILDAESGAVRARFRNYGDSTAVVGGVVFRSMHGMDLKIHDLTALDPKRGWWQIEPQRTTRHEGFSVQAVTSSGAIWARDGALFLARRADRPEEPLVRIQGLEAAKLARLWAAGTLAVAEHVSGGLRLHAIDLERAACLYETAFGAAHVLVDSAGWLAAGPSAVACFDPSRLRWKQDLAGATLRALGRSAVLVEAAGVLYLIDRASGRSRDLGPAKAATLAADKIFTGAGTEVIAHDPRAGRSGVSRYRARRSRSPSSLRCRGASSSSRATSAIASARLRIRVGDVDAVSVLERDQDDHGKRHRGLGWRLDPGRDRGIPKASGPGNSRRSRIG